MPAAWLSCLLRLMKRQEQTNTTDLTSPSLQVFVSSYVGIPSTTRLVPFLFSCLSLP